MRISSPTDEHKKRRSRVADARPPVSARAGRNHIEEQYRTMKEILEERQESVEHERERFDEPGWSREEVISAARTGRGLVHGLPTPNRFAG